MLKLSKYKKYYYKVHELSDDKRIDVVKLSLHKKKLQIAQNDFLKLQNRSKIINVEPLYNRKEYLGTNSMPLPVERFLIELTYPKVTLAIKD